MRSAHAIPPCPTPAQIAASVLQEAAERASQRDLAGVLGTSGVQKAEGRPALQAAFCIDVRSEVYRRALEGLDPVIQTLGFAGFFGLKVAHRDFASDVEEARLPVLLNAGLHTSAVTPANRPADQSARLSARATRAWGRFKLAAVSSFAFVEAAGSILRAMSLGDRFAPVVLLIGHGANVVNNPHASALHCGACGGYAGDVNARLLASLLNDPAVRSGLAQDGITIPLDTVFVAGLHDTTTDAITLYEDENARVPDQIKTWLSAATALARTERAVRLPRAKDGDAVVARSTDWAETRPEWALAGCQAFIAAPRDRTRGKPLGGRAFLHDYDWQKDDGFKVLELILTAPVVVASWISLQYYGSVVAPDLFGSGNKLLHNVTGGIGVIEGNAGILRSGLPWQSVHDGTDLAHAPLRLAVCVAAPSEAINAILERHLGVRALFDNRWMHLFLLDANGGMSHRYSGDLTWQAC